MTCCGDKKERSISKMYNDVTDTENSIILCDAKDAYQVTFRRATGPIYSTNKPSIIVKPKATTERMHLEPPLPKR